MADIATLGIKVTTEGVADAAKQLGGLEQAGAKAEKATRGKLPGAFKVTSQAADQLAKSAGNASDQLRKAADPLDRYAAAARRAGLSQGELKNALRTVPAQITDIVTSLQAGQSPLTVFIQQGGQIRDQFGSAGLALRAVGGQLLSLINPVTVLAAVLVTLSVAYAKAEAEASKLNKALILSGNQSGATADQLAEIAFRIDQVAGTQSAATAALVAIAQSGRFAASEIEGIATATEKFRIATGTAVEDTVNEFKRLATDPVNAIQELNRQYGFLDAATFRQIQTLKQEGREREAQTLAINTYASFLDETADRITANQTNIETGWKAITSSVYEFGDALLDVFRNDAGSELRALEKELASIQSESIFNTFNATPEFKAQRIAEIQARITEIQEGAAQAAEKAERDAQSRRAQNTAIALEAEAAAVASAEEKRAQRILSVRNRADEAIRIAQAEGNAELVAQLEANRDKIVKAIEEEGRARQRRVRRGPADQGLGILQSIQQQIALNQQLLNSEDKLSAAERFRTSVLTRLKDERLKTTAATREAIAAALDELDVINAELKGREQQAAQEAFRTSIAQTEALLQGPLKIAELEHIQRLEQIAEAARKASVSSADLERAKAAEQARFEAESKAIREREDVAGQLIRDLEFELSLIGLTNAEREKAIALRQLEGKATEGQVARIGELIDQTEKARKTEAAFESFKSGVTDAFASIIDGSKSAKDALNDFAQSITQIVAKLLAQKAVEALFGNALNANNTAPSAAGGGNIFASIIGALFGGGSAKGNAFAAGNVIPFRRGGVVDRTTPFGMSGGRFGIMGEAGPEAILPLYRGRDGKLGVRMADGGFGGAGGSPQQLTSNLTVNVQGRVDRRTQDQIAAETSRRLRVAARQA